MTQIVTGIIGTVNMIPKKNGVIHMMTMMMTTHKQQQVGTQQKHHQEHTHMAAMQEGLLLMSLGWMIGANKAAMLIHHFVHRHTADVVRRI